jgi:hypothetical protein
VVTPYTRKDAPEDLGPEERAAWHRTEFAIEACVNAPREPRHKLSDHAWDPRTWRCNVCGISKQNYYDVMYGVGIPCR